MNKPTEVLIFSTKATLSQGPVAETGTIVLMHNKGGGVPPLVEMITGKTTGQCEICRYFLFALSFLALESFFSEVFLMTIRNHPTSLDKGRSSEKRMKAVRGGHHL